LKNRAVLCCHAPSHPVVHTTPKPSGTGNLRTCQQAGKPLGTENKKSRTSPPNRTRAGASREQCRCARHTVTCPLYHGTGSSNNALVQRLCLCLCISQDDAAPSLWASKWKSGGLLDGGMGRWWMGIDAWLFLLLVPFD